jgi:cytosine/adenosine deaminase-related metal-dependent hydrolase
MLYINATIITVNAKREIIPNGALLVQDNRIKDLGKTVALVAKHADEPKYDLTGHIVIPGLISTHMHTAQTLLRGTHN